MEHQDALARIVSDVIAPAAAIVDRDAVYPRQGLDALAEAGLLGLISSPDVGGMGLGFDAVIGMVADIGAVCGSTATVVCMHFAGTAAIEAHGPTAVREAIAAGNHVTTLAFSESGSRSQFWAPMSTAVAAGGEVRLDAKKSWVTSAGEADSYVWSSRPVAADGPMTLWLVPSDAAGLSVTGTYDGLGLRGNASSPVVAEGVVVGEDARLGEDGAGLDIALAAVLPWFLLLNAAASVGMMRGAVGDMLRHMTGTRFEHLDQTLAEQQSARVELARAQLETDLAATLLDDAASALASGREDGPLRMLEVKVAAGEAAIRVTDDAMRVCGGAAFRKELGLERRFRDARATRVMAPTTDALLDFIGRAMCGFSLLGEV